MKEPTDVGCFDPRPKYVDRSHESLVEFSEETRQKLEASGFGIFSPPHRSLWELSETTYPTLVSDVLGLAMEKRSKASQCAIQLKQSFLPFHNSTEQIEKTTGLRSRLKQIEGIEVMIGNVTDYASLLTNIKKQNPKYWESFIHRIIATSTTIDENAIACISVLPSGLTVVSRPENITNDPNPIVPVTMPLIFPSVYFTHGLQK